MKKTQITDYFQSSKSKEKPKQQPRSASKEPPDTQEEVKMDIEVQNVISPFSEFKQGLQSWAKPLEKFTSGKVFSSIYEFVKNEYKTKTIYPKEEDIFNAFKLTPISSIKAVIVGQDPYHGPNQAHGLCFSVLRPTKPPPSLVNIFKNLQSDPMIDFKTYAHGDLTNWAKQGILLMNATLTVEKKKPNSHQECGWQLFTDQVIKIINEQCQGVVFFLWGAFAQKKGSNIDKKKHLVIKTSHPSPYSVNNGFSSSRQFSQCNNYLKSQGKTPIDWNY